MNAIYMFQYLMIQSYEQFAQDKIIVTDKFKKTLEILNKEN